MNPLMPTCVERSTWCDDVELNAFRAKKLASAPPYKTFNLTTNATHLLETRAKNLILECTNTSSLYG